MAVYCVQLALRVLGELKEYFISKTPAEGSQSLRYITKMCLHVCWNCHCSVCEWTFVYVLKKCIKMC